MLCFINLVKFQVKLYVKNSYFVMLVITTTATMELYQYLAHYVNQTYTGQEWLIAGIMGTWASCTTSAGALAYQRWQGTLPYLLNSGISRELVLLATLSPAAIYGLVAFPLAGVLALVLGMPVANLSWTLGLGIVILWLTATVLSYFISLLFILTRNAMAYEELVLTPILLLSGLLTIPSFALPYLKPVQMLSPLTLPIKLIYQEKLNLELILTYLLVTIFFFFISKILTEVVIKRAFKENRLGVF